MEGVMIKRYRSGDVAPRSPEPGTMHMQDDDNGLWVYQCSSDSEAWDIARDFAVAHSEESASEYVARKLADREFCLEIDPAWKDSVILDSVTDNGSDGVVWWFVCPGEREEYGVLLSESGAAVVDRDGTPVDECNMRSTLRRSLVSAAEQEAARG